MAKKDILDKEFGIDNELESVLKAALPAALKIVLKSVLQAVLKTVLVLRAFLFPDQETSFHLLFIKRFDNVMRALAYFVIRLAQVFSKNTGRQ